MSVNAPHKIGTERVRPRKRRPKKSVWRGKIWPLIVFTLTVAVATVLLMKVAKPFRLYAREARETRQLAMQLEQTRRENIELRRRIRYLQTPEGSAQAARKLGWVKPGEITLVFPSDPKPQRDKRNR